MSYNLIIRSDKKNGGDNNNFSCNVGSFRIPRNENGYKLKLKSLVVCPQKDVIGAGVFAIDQLNYFESDYIEIILDLGNANIWDGETTNKIKYIVPNNKASTLWSDDMNEGFPRTIIYQTGNQPEYILNNVDLSNIECQIFDDDEVLLTDKNDNDIRKVILNFQIDLI